MDGPELIITAPPVWVGEVDVYPPPATEIEANAGAVAAAKRMHAVMTARNERRMQYGVTARPSRNLSACGEVCGIGGNDGHG